MDVAEGGPAGSEGGPAEGVPRGPLSSQALKGQRLFSPVFMVISIHSTFHPIKRVENHNWRKPTITSIWVTGGQLSRDRTSKQDPLLTTLPIRNHPHLPHDLLCTIAKDWCCSVDIDLALASIFPRIIKASAIRWSLTTTSLTSTEVQHNPSQALSIFLSACLDGDDCHRCTLKNSYDKVPASGATFIPRCNKKIDGSQNANRGSPN